MAEKAPPAKVAEQLAAFYRRNGYVRRQNAKRLNKEGYMGYKKGDEIRLVVATKAELATVKKLLKAAGVRHGKPFAKAQQIAVPIYGRDQVARFLKLIGSRG
ncbi:MAG: hypothetical protein KIS87_10745 [Phycisphaeraceae bacterium]|nr:hypothetical protein [Phycisphaeraceae bacterium]